MPYVFVYIFSNTPIKSKITLTLNKVFIPLATITLSLPMITLLCMSLQLQKILILCDRETIIQAEIK